MPLPRFLRMTLVTGLTCAMPVLALYAQQPPPTAPASQPAAKAADQERGNIDVRPNQLSGSRKKGSSGRKSWRR